MEANKNKGLDKEYTFRTLELINSWTSNVDAKASFALAFAAAVLTLIFYNAGSLPLAFSHFINASESGTLTWKELLSAGVLVVMYVSFIGAIWKFFESLRGNINRKKMSLFFFGSISDFPLDEYRNRLLNMSTKELEDDLCEQIHTNSIICTKKFEAYNRGLKWLRTATVLCVLSLLLGFM